jgi:hypothetical protein
LGIDGKMQYNPGWESGSGAPVAFAPLSEGGVCHAFNDVALSIGDGVY